MDKTQLEFINDILTNNNYAKYSGGDVDTIYKIFKHDIIDPKTENSEILRYNGIYYEIREDYENAKKYYLMALEKKNIMALHSLGCMYYELEDYENMKKYLLMAVKENIPRAMHRLAYYYDEQHDHENVLKYYLMAIEKGHDVAM